MNKRYLPKIPISKLMLDGSDIVRDAHGVPHVAIQRDDTSMGKKYCQVYRFGTSGDKEDHDWHLVLTVLDMKGAPKIKIWNGGVGIVFGHAVDYTPIIEEIDGFFPFAEGQAIT